MSKYKSSAICGGGLAKTLVPILGMKICANIRGVNIYSTNNHSYYLPTSNKFILLN
jgi:hypothetical protein